MSNVTMYSTPWCGYCHRLKGQMDRAGIAYDVVDIEQDPSAAEIVMAFFEEISTELERGETVKLSGFGVFCLRNKNSRPGRNPKTGQMIPVSARRVVMFHPSHILKALVQRERPIDRPRSNAAALQPQALEYAEEFPIAG